jgi:hypothetical protein
MNITAATAKGQRPYQEDTFINVEMKPRSSWLKTSLDSLKRLDLYA